MKTEFGEDTMMRYNLTRAELKDKCADEFHHGDVIKCGKYFIWIKYGEYSSPIKTCVSTDDDIRNLKMSKWPYYISDFIHRRREYDAIQQ
jgi:hypothetical protein